MSNDTERMYTFKTLEAGDVNVELARQLQAVGADAWASALPERGPEQIANVFDPVLEDPSKQDELLNQYKSFARHGALTVAFAREDGAVAEPVGYTLIRNAVSGHPVKQIALKTFSKVPIIKAHAPVSTHIFAEIYQVSVRAADQRHGVGTGLLKRGLGRGKFTPERVPTAHIFDENEIAKAFFGAKGFERSFERVPGDQLPSEEAAFRYFGPNNPRVDQYRYAASSVQEVRYSRNK